MVGLSVLGASSCDTVLSSISILAVTYGCGVIQLGLTGRLETRGETLPFSKEPPRLAFTDGVPTCPHQMRPLTVS